MVYVLGLERCSRTSGLELKHDLFRDIFVLRWDFVLTEATSPCYLEGTSQSG